MRRLGPSAIALFVVTAATPLLSSSISRAEARAEGRGPAGHAVNPTIIESTDLTPIELAEIRRAIEDQSWDAALGLVRKRLAAPAVSADEAGLRLLEARLLERLGRQLGAAQVFRKLLDDPEVGDAARRELHELYVRRGNFDAADLLTQAVEGEATPELLRLRGYSLNLQGAYRSCVSLLDTPALAEDDAGRVLRANALLALGARDAAERLYLAVLETSSEVKVRQAAHFGLGQVARLRGARAMRVLQDERAIRLGPAPWAELDLGLGLRALGRRAEAREHLEVVVRDYPALAATARLALARLDEEEGLAEEGLEHLVAALTGSFGDFLALTRLGELLAQEGRGEDGIVAYRVAHEMFPEFPPARERLTRALTARGRWEEVPEEPPAGERWELPNWTWDRLLDGDLPYHEVVADRDSVPLDDPRRVVLALVHLRAGSPAAAIGWTEGAGVEQERLAEIRAEALEAVERDEEAIELWTRLLDAPAVRPLAQERLALLLFEENPDQAQAYWEALFAEHPQRVRPRLRMARKLEDAARYREARDVLVASQESVWLSAKERRRVEVAIADLDDLIEEQDEQRME